jgi:hypothetical protein
MSKRGLVAFSNNGHVCVVIVLIGRQTDVLSVDSIPFSTSSGFSTFFSFPFSGFFDGQGSYGYIIRI